MMMNIVCSLCRVNKSGGCTVLCCVVLYCVVLYCVGGQIMDRLETVDVSPLICPALSTQYHSM